MTNQDEPAYMLAAREYVRYGDSVLTLSTGTVEALLQRIGQLEQEKKELTGCMVALHETQQVRHATEQLDSEREQVRDTELEILARALLAEGGSIDWECLLPAGKASWLQHAKEVFDAMHAVEHPTN